jgi:hypothetical protein
MELPEAIECIRRLAPNTCDTELGEAATKLLLAYEADEAALNRMTSGLCDLRKSLEALPCKTS